MAARTALFLTKKSEFLRYRFFDKIWYWVEIYKERKSAVFLTILDEKYSVCFRIVSKSSSHTSKSNILSGFNDCDFETVLKYPKYFFIYLFIQSPKIATRKERKIIFNFAQHHFNIDQNIRKFTNFVIRQGEKNDLRTQKSSYSKYSN